ncbi:hypothetical protein B0G80_8950 [Paraburkholderia sp. BL6669N2]|uniref:hypothetical protein n=1 Tax=Paraburkholderia sp. BL6669N2 TaxID=1938807 RepID=UPI000E283C3A|nr:hypothetical protein [Paraburkholderia sp. BL6669N2]REG52403.1 hypothetical protein B0G80_8950 [Paraburkholderia sp. BL6669N2]
MSIFWRALCLLLTVLALGTAEPCAAQSATGASAEEAASPTLVFDRNLLLGMLGAANVPGHDDQVQLTREQAMRLLGGTSDAQRNRVMFTLIIASFSFVALSLIIMLLVVGLVRWSFWRRASLEGPHKWRTYLLQLPLGAPEGSVRALLSLFVVVFGFLVIALQGYLSLGNTEAIAGFVGAVITFYFTSRNSEQARKAILQAHAAADATATNVANVIQTAADAATTAQRENSDRMTAVTKSVFDKSAETATIALRTIADTAAGATGASAADAAPSAQSQLSSLRDRLTAMQQVARGVSDLGLGGETLPAAAATVATVSDLLGKIQPLLSGKADAASITGVLQEAGASLPTLEAAGLPGALAESIEVLRTAASPILAGLPGGPVGIVGGVLIAGIRLAGRQRDLNTFKAALLSKPFDPVLLPDAPDEAQAAAAFAISPLMQAHFPNADPPTRLALMALATHKNEDGTRRNAADIAQPCADDIANRTANVLPARGPNTEFTSVAELTHAFDEYLGSLVHLNAKQALPADATLTAGTADAAPQPGLQMLADAARQLLPDPKAAAQLERLVYLGEALGKLPIDKQQAVNLVTDALSVAAQSALVLTRTEESP